MIVTSICTFEVGGRNFLPFALLIPCLITRGYTIFFCRPKGQGALQVAQELAYMRDTKSRDLLHEHRVSVPSQRYDFIGVSSERSYIQDRGCAGLDRDEPADFVYNEGHEQIEVLRLELHIVLVV
jgi:hypothetical protein